MHRSLTTPLQSRPTQPGARRALVPARWTAAALAGCLFAMPAFAVEYQVSGQTEGWAGGFGQSQTAPPGLESRFGSTPLDPLLVRSEANITGGTGAIYGVGQTYAVAQRGGGLHLSAVGRAEAIYADANGANAGGSGRAQAQYADFFTLNVPGYAAGTVFTMTVPIRVDATLVHEAQYDGGPDSGYVEGVATWDVSASLTQWVTGGTSASFNARRTCSSNSYGTVCQGDDVGLYTLSFSMSNLTMQALMGVNASAFAKGYAGLPYGGNAVGGGVADLLHTVAWGGISELRDPNGVLVSNFSAPSTTTDLDYRNAYVSAVPDAPTSLLLAIGLAAIGTQRRRQSSRAAAD